jgi:hypothetical protein
MRCLCRAPPKTDPVAAFSEMARTSPADTSPGGDAVRSFRCRGADRPGARLQRGLVTPPYQQPGANVAFWTLFGLFALGEYALRFHSHSNRSGRRAERCSLLVVLAAVVGGMLGGFSLASWKATSIDAGRWPLFVLGLVLMAVGVFVRRWAILLCSAGSSPSTFACMPTKPSSTPRVSSSRASRTTARASTRTTSSGASRICSAAHHVGVLGCA